MSEELASSSATFDAISTARTLDLSALPKDLAKDLTKAFDSADEAIASLADGFTAEEAVNEAAVAYRPLMREVRFLQKEIREAEEELKDIKTALSREGGDVAKLEARMAKLEALIEKDTAEIPAEWDEQYKTFSTLTKAEDKARNTYRRSADQSWEGVAEVLAVLEANDAFTALEGDLMAMRATIETTPPEEAEELVNELSRDFGRVDGAGDVKSALSKARRALKNKTPDPVKAMEEYEEAVAAYDEQKVWRAEAASLKPGLQAYLDGIAETLGARQQQRLSEDQALYLAACTAGHRDLSLNF